MTLADLFDPFDGEWFKDRLALERRVIDAVNEHVTALPAGFSYKDAIDGARNRGWLVTNGGTGVTVKLSPASQHAAA